MEWHPVAFVSYTHLVKIAPLAIKIMKIRTFTRFLVFLGSGILPPPPLVAVLVLDLDVVTFVLLLPPFVLSRADMAPVVVPVAVACWPGMVVVVITVVELLLGKDVVGLLLSLPVIISCGGGGGGGVVLFVCGTGGTADAASCGCCCDVVGVAADGITTTSALSADDDTIGT
jgi:hypothetical protein